MGAAFSRRAFLSLGIVAAAGGVRRASAATGACFVGQSGEPQSGRVTLGLLMASDETALRAWVGQLRADTSYRRVLRSRSTDKYKVAFAERLIDGLLARQDTRFIAFDLTVPAWPKTPAERALLVGRIAAPVFAEAPAGVTIHAVDNDDGTNFGELYSASAPSPQRRIAYSKIAQDDLLQIAAFLAGLTAGAPSNSTRSAKAQLRDRLKAQLAVPEIGARSLAAHPVFQIRAVDVSL